MTTPRRLAYLLVPGAGGAGWYWHRVVAELRDRGYSAEAIDLPTDDEQAGLADYAEVIVTAGAKYDELVLVGQSMGAFSVAIAAQTLQPSRIVLMNAMVPRPGETPGDWWDNVGASQARTEAARQRGYPVEFDLATYFLHDVPPDVAAAGERYQRNQADRPFGDACAFTSWPASVRVVSGRDDRFFPLPLQQKVARDRLGVDVEVVPGGHLAALSYPVESAAAVIRV